MWFTITSPAIGNLLIKEPTTNSSIFRTVHVFRTFRVPVKWEGVLIFLLHCIKMRVADIKEYLKKVCSSSLCRSSSSFNFFQTLIYILNVHFDSICNFSWRFSVCWFHVHTKYYLGMEQTWKFWNLNLRNLGISNLIWHINQTLNLCSKTEHWTSKADKKTWT